VTSNDMRNFTASAVVTTAFTNNANASFLIYGISDFAGNVAMNISSTSDDSYVYVDFTAPNITSLSVSTSNIYSALRATTKDVVVFSFTFSEAVRNVVVTIAGENRPVTALSNVYSANITVSSIHLDGVIVIVINASDIVGNVKSVSNSSSVVIDKTSPTLVSWILNTTNTVSNAFAKKLDIVNLFATFSESVAIWSIDIASTSATVTYSSALFVVSTITATSSVPEGYAAVTIRVRDQAGNNATIIRNSNVLIDMTPPTSVIMRQPPLTTNNGTAELAFVSDSSVTYTCFLSHDGTLTLYQQNCISPLVLKGLTDGVYNFTLKSMDFAGNLGTTSPTYTWTVDRTPPSIVTLTIQSTYSNPRVITPSVNAILNVTTAELVQPTARAVFGGSVVGTLLQSNVTKQLTFNISGAQLSDYFTTGQYLTFELSQVTDLVGNVLPTVTEASLTDFNIAFGENFECDYIMVIVLCICFQIQRNFLDI
jgi:hypothetical protein